MSSSPSVRHRPSFSDLPMSDDERGGVVIVESVLHENK